MRFLNYLVDNIPLFCICLVMIFIAIRNLKLRRRESIYFLVFTGIVIMLSISVAFENTAKETGNILLGTIGTSLGYILRPILLYVFILLATLYNNKSHKYHILWTIPIYINIVVYILPFFFNNEVLSKLVFYYQLNGDGTASFMRGGFLNFTSHAVCTVYAGLVTYISIFQFHGKHKRDGMVLLLCVIIIFVTVATEMASGRNNLLNIVCEICAMMNYIFIISINNSRDSLTHLYDRKTYNEDIARYKNQINGIIQFDMNGLKYLNDNFGHEEGDKALHDIAEIFEKSHNEKNMNVYRLSGDEFLILMINGKESDLLDTVKSIKKELSATKYSAAVGYYYISNDSNISFEEAMKEAENLMYLDKENYYKSTGIKRRKI